MSVYVGRQDLAFAGGGEDRYRGDDAGKINASLIQPYFIRDD
jgi:hypothetical protein